MRWAGGPICSAPRRRTAHDDRLPPQRCVVATNLSATEGKSAPFSPRCGSVRLNRNVPARPRAEHNRVLSQSQDDRRFEPALQYRQAGEAPREQRSSTPEVWRADGDRYRARPRTFVRVPADGGERAEKLVTFAATVPGLLAWLVGSERMT